MLGVPSTFTRPLIAADERKYGDFGKFHINVNIREAAGDVGVMLKRKSPLASI